MTRKQMDGSFLQKVKHAARVDVMCYGEYFSIEFKTESGRVIDGIIPYKTEIEARVAAENWVGALEIANGIHPIN